MVAVLPMVRPPTADDVGAFLGMANPPAHAGAVLQAVTRLARGYTRGNGWETAGGLLPEDLAGAVLSATARRLQHVEGIAAKEIGDVRLEFDRSGWAWSLAERVVLDRYRLRVG